MLNEVVLVLLTALSVLGVLYAEGKILGIRPKINFINIVLIFVLIGVISFSYETTEMFIRVIIIFLLTSLVSTTIYEEKINKTLVGTFCAFIILIISEILVGSFYAIITHKSGAEFNSGTFLSIQLNFLIFVLVVVMSNMKTFKKFGKLLIANSEKIKLSHTFLMIVTGILSAVIYLYFTYHELSMQYLIVANVMVVFMYLFILYSYFTETNKSININREYNITKKNLQEYEEMYENQRIENHENKNQLYILKNLISKDNKEALKYITEVTNEKFNEDKEIINMLKRVPIGGLRGILYSKLKLVKNKGYITKLDISKNIKEKDFNKIGDDLNIKICSIVAIFLDNSIEALSKIKNKKIEKLIEIKMNLKDENIIISISNTFEGKIDIDNIDKKGYSSNGKSRGYGLSIVNDIIEKQDRIENQKQIIDNLFIQKIIIKI